MNGGDNHGKAQQAPRMAGLDLGKHGLGGLAGKRLRELTSSELDEVMEAFAKEDIAPNIGPVVEPERIGELLKRSYCRGCGKCCLGANTLNPLHPGIEVYEDELKAMGKHGRVSYKLLRKRTRAGQLLRNPGRPGESARTRWLPFPCAFYNTKAKRCRVYEARPIVCKIYPLTLENSLCVKVNCEYGKDIYKSFVTELKNRPRLSFTSPASSL